MINFNKRLYLFVKMLLFLSLFLYFGKINLAIGKIKNYKNNTYTHNKVSLKKNTLNNHIANHTKEKKNKTNHHSLLDESNSSGLSIWSNSFNFAKSANSRVDPRTGMLLISMKVGLLQSNFGHGPDIDLEMNYNSGATGNPDHLGRGWAWNMTHYNPATHQLNTAGGKSFFLQQQPDGSWNPLYHKLKDVIITNEKGELVIKSANGIKDILDHDGYEIRMEQQNGEGVNFNYISGSHLLKKITDDNGHSIWLTRKDNYLTVTSYDVQGHPVNIRVSLENDQVRNIWFPESNQQQSDNDSGQVRLSYDTYNNGQNLLTGIHYFTGMEKEFTYDCSHEMKLPRIMNNQNSFQPFKSMCVVRQVRMIPGANQPPMHTDYSYTSTNSNSHDYLGFNAGLTELPGLKTDILFEAPTSYTYQTKEDNGKVQVIRMYNKYHLLIGTKTISDETDKLLKQTIVDFCHTDKEDGCANTSFNQLPDTWSLPLKIVTIIWGDNLSAPVTTTVNRSYDNYGRLISQTDSYGRKTETIYCPQNGDRFCPAAPVGWPVASLAEKTKKIPALLKNSASLSPVITTMTYKKETNRNNKGYTLVLYQNSVQSGNEQRIEMRYYYQDKNNPLTYGLLKQRQLTGTNLPAESVKEITHHYQYTLNNNGTETISDYIDTGNNQSVSSVITEKSVFIPKTLRVISEDKKNIQTFKYDVLGRITAHTDATGTPFETTTRTQYQLSPNENSVIVTMPDGMQKKVMFDGLGRKLATYSEKTDLQGHPEPGIWQQQTRISYNDEGKVATSTRYGQGQRIPVALTTRFDYDNLGRLIKKYLPDGETEITQYDNAHRCVVHYSEDAQNDRTAVTIGLSSITGKLLEQIILPATKGILPSVKILCTAGDKQPGARVSRMTYDGFNRLVSIEDPMGRVVQKRYNAFGHVTDIINPAGDRIHNIYDLTGHVIQHLVMPIQGGQYLLASAGFNAAGQKLWSAREDGKKTTYHYNVNGQLSAIDKSNGHHIILSYNNIGKPVTDSLDGKIFLRVSYDHHNYKPLTISDNTGITTYHYRNDGLLASTIHKGINGYASNAETLTYNSYHDLISRTDSQHNKIIYKFDKLVRPVEKTYQENNGNTTQIEQLFYDSFSRLVKKVYGNGMIRLLTYNPWGEIEIIKDSINGKLLHSESFVYDADGNIIRLQRSDDQNRQATIHYRYDRLDNLVSMQCEGDNKICPHDTVFSDDNLKTAPAIMQQDYKFTRLNRIASVSEKLLDTSSPEWHSLSKKMFYIYANAKVPLRLTAVSTQWNNQRFETDKLFYDAAGNMIIDGQGNQVSYNSFNQITRVISITGRVSRYNYDGQGKEIKVVTQKGVRQMLYQEGALSGEVVTDTANNIHRISYPSAETKTTDSMITDWNESDYKGDVISILKQDKTLKQWTVQQHNIYSPYGMEWSYGKQEVTIPAFQQTLKGFDGEITDTATGWQFLGNGNRTYNPSQRYFVSEDLAGDGYAFGSNNPIMNSDSSGNMPKWLGDMFKISSLVITLGMKNVHSHLLQGIGRSMLWAGISLSLGPAFAIGMAFAVPAALTFSSALKPANKGLQQASMITGRIFSGTLFAAGLATIITGIGAAAGLIGTTEAGLTGLEAFAEESSEAGTDFESIANIIRTNTEIDGDSLSSGELENSVNGNNMLANAKVNVEIENNQSVSVVDGRPYLEDVPGANRAIFGCGNNEDCYHDEMMTFSEYSEDGSDIRLFPGETIENAVNEAGKNVYDEILQEYSRANYLKLAYITLRPGGRLYVMVTDQGNGFNWLYGYTNKGADLFGDDNVGAVKGIENIAKVAKRFGVIRFNESTYKTMVVFIKPDV